MFVYLRPYRSADAFIDDKLEPSVKSIITFATMMMPHELQDQILGKDATDVWNITSEIPAKHRFVFLAAIIWSSVLHHGVEDVLCVSFSELIDRNEHEDHPGLQDSITDCIRTCEAYAVIVGRQRIPEYDKEVYMPKTSDLTKKILNMIDRQKGVWKLIFIDGFPVHELIIHNYEDRYRIVQSNVGQYTMAQFCFHWPTPPMPNVSYGTYGLPYTNDRTSSTKQQVQKFLEDVQVVSGIPVFETVSLKRLLIADDRETSNMYDDDHLQTI